MFNREEFYELERKIKERVDPRIVEAVEKVPYRGSMMRFSIDCEAAAREARMRVLLEDSELKLVG